MLYSDKLSSIIILKRFQDQVRNKQNDCTKAGPEIQIKECKNDRKTCWKDRTDLMPKKLQACPLRQSDRKRRSGMHTLQSRIISGLGAFSNWNRNPIDCKPYVVEIDLKTDISCYVQAKTKMDLYCETHLWKWKTSNAWALWWYDHWWKLRFNSCSLLQRHEQGPLRLTYRL